VSLVVLAVFNCGAARVSRRVTDHYDARLTKTQLAAQGISFVPRVCTLARSTLKSLHKEAPEMQIIGVHLRLEADWIHQLITFRPVSRTARPHNEVRMHCGKYAMWIAVGYLAAPFQRAVDQWLASQNGPIYKKE